MSILSTIKKGYLSIKTATGYMKLLPHTLSTLVTMNDGTTLENKISKINTNLSNCVQNIAELKNKKILLFDSEREHQIWETGNALYINANPFEKFEFYALGGQCIAIGFKEFDSNVQKTIINIGGAGMIYNGSEFIPANYHGQVDVYDTHLYLQSFFARTYFGNEYQQPIVKVYGIKA